MRRASIVFHPAAEGLDFGAIVACDHEAWNAIVKMKTVKNADVETVTLSIHSEFLALIERARARHKREGGIKSKELGRRLGLQSTSSRTRPAP